MIRRESFQPLPDRAPYFWIETPIGSLCFARRPPSLTRSWGMEIRTQQSRAVDLYKEAAETEDPDIAGTSTFPTCGRRCSDMAGSQPARWPNGT